MAPQIKMVYVCVYGKERGVKVAGSDEVKGNN